MTITEKTAYLKGLLEGMNLDESTNEGKLLCAIVDVVNDIALELADIELQTETIHDELDAIEDTLDEYDVAFEEIEENLEDLYELIEDTEYDDCCDCCDDDCDCDCDDCDDCDCDCDDCDEIYYELECPTCAEKIVLDEDMLANGGMKCPACGEEIEFDFSELLDEIEEEDAEDNL